MWNPLGDDDDDFYDDSTFVKVSCDYFLILVYYRLLLMKEL